MGLLNNTIHRISSLDPVWELKARERLDRLTKPPGSLGVLEDIAARMAGMQRTLYPNVDRKAVIIMAADHGIACSGVSAYPQEVTAQMLANFVNGGAAINVLARQAGADVILCDVGVAGPELSYSPLLARRIRPGTANMVESAAMTRDEAIRAVELGIEVASNAINQGVCLLATGEMGIGNTSSSTALLACCTGVDLTLITGRGTGLDDDALQLKRQMIARALEFNNPNPSDPVDMLAKVGGLEIGALCGVILAAAAARTPVVIDGFISGAAALLAQRFAPLSRDYMIASHLSQEPGHAVMMEALDLQPVLYLNMRLGEGTGAVLAFSLIEAAARLIREMATFEEAGVSG